MKTIPDKINVGGLVYTIKQCDSAHDVACSSDREDWGRIYFRDCEIRIFSKLAPQRKRTVLMHELVHALCEITQIELSENDTDRLAVAFVDMLDRNKLW